MKRLAVFDAAKAELIAYYTRLIAEEVRHRFGSELNANLVTLNLPPDISVTEAIRSLQLLGAEAGLFCSSAHQPSEVAGFELPLLSIYEPVTRALQTSALRRVGLIGTREAAEEKRWQAALVAGGISDCLFPVLSDRRHLVELCDREFGHGLVTEMARADVVRIVHSLKQAGARAVVVLAPELVEVLQDAVPVLPIYNVAEYRALAAVDWMTAHMAPVLADESRKTLL